MNDNILTYIIGTMYQSKKERVDYLVNKFFPGDPPEDKQFLISKKTFRAYIEMAMASGQEYEAMMMLVCINSGDVPEELENDPAGLAEIRKEYLEKMNKKGERTFDDLRREKVKGSG